MKFKELEDLLQIIRVEQSLGNESVDDLDILLYVNGKAGLVDKVYIAENRVYNDKVLVIR